MSNDRIVVVGAGLAGLACAFDLSRAGRDVVLVEASSRAGGVVGTREIGGFRFEEGPHTIQARAAAFRTLCGDLGIADRLVTSSSRGASRWLWFRGELVELPAGPRALVTTRLLSWRAKLGVVRERFRRFEAPPDDAPEPTFDAFLRERIGVEPTRRIAAAFVRGVYAADIAELGARSAFPRLWNACVEHGGLLRAAGALRRAPREALPGPAAPPSALISFPRGLQDLVDALAAALGPRLRLATRVARIERNGSDLAVVLASGERIVARHVVCCVAAPEAATLLGAIARVDLAPLARIRHASIAVVHQGFSRGAFEPFLPGFGFLVPPDERDHGSTAPTCLGTISTSNLFDERAPDGGRSTASFYAARDVAGLDDEQLVRRAAADLALVARRSEPARPIVTHVRRWNDVIPRYEPGHRERVLAIETRLASELPSVELAGSWIGGVSVDDVIARGRLVARRIVGQRP